MKKLGLCALAIAIMGLLSANALAENAPMEEPTPAPTTGQDTTQAPAEMPGAQTTAAPDADLLKTALEQTEYDRLIKPITDFIERAGNYMELYEKELQKPEEKQNLTLADRYRSNAAQFYKSAVQAAKSAEGALEQDELKQAVEEQFEKPAQEKAEKILADLAEDAKTRTDQRAAENERREIQAIRAITDQFFARRDKIKNDNSLKNERKLAEMKRLQTEYRNKLGRTLVLTAVLKKDNDRQPRGRDNVRTVVMLQNFSIPGILFTAILVPREKVNSFSDGETVKVKCALKDVTIGGPPEWKIDIVLGDMLSIEHLTQKSK